MASQRQLSFDRLGAGSGPQEPKTYTVSELVRLASRRLESRFGDVWVEGEVSNLRVPASGHCYFTLKDGGAQLAVVMFRSTAARLRFRLEDGQQLRCRGKLGIYDAQGQFQLTAMAAEPTGLGALQLAFEQLKRKLQAEGLFDPRHKQPLPQLPRSIAVVTSATGAALRDILRVLGRRCPVRVVLCPTAVQGAEAPGAIVRALRRADALGLDLIIVGRGGGSLEDLWAFNDEAVARAIHAAKTPVISAVGHEVDVTIADLVADLRAPTPSAAAELAVPVMRELQQQLQQQRARLSQAMTARLRSSGLQLERLRRRMGSPLEQVNRRRLDLDRTAARLQRQLGQLLRQRGQQLQRLQTRLAAQEPRARLTRSRDALREGRRRLLAGARARLEHGQQQLERLTAQLRALNPLSVLERGFGLVLDADGALVAEASRVAVGQQLRIRLASGELLCRVEQVLPPDDDAPPRRD